MKEKNTIEIFTEGGVRLPFKNVNKANLKKTALNAVRHLGLVDVLITMIFTDNNVIRDINRKYREKDNPTDVISFAYRENPFPVFGPGPENLGDIYISLEKAKEQADKNSEDLPDEISRLIIHGILHLAGYDHEKSANEADRMNKMESEIFRQLREGK